MKNSNDIDRSISAGSASTAEISTVPASLENVRLLSSQGRRGEVRFFLQRVPGGIHVEREEIPQRGLRTLQSLHFNHPAGFERWCDGDPIRFEHPLLHARLKRAADELWHLDSGPGDST